MKKYLLALSVLILSNVIYGQNSLTFKRQVIVDSEGNGSGLKFTGINSSTTTSTVTGKTLTLDAQGNVILAQVPAIPSGASIWSLTDTIATTTVAAAVIGRGVSIPRGNPYGLYVSKGILTQKVRVAVLGSTYWADYVFDKNYKLPSLKSVEKYITLHKHLPDVPSSEEVTQNGIDFAEMQATLLRKIEELTLYTIALEKKVLALEKRKKK
ncbi:hypothetical protein [Flectobacillus major]|jgi:hypothetical protein|uniref:hypothetical protein n=1 Tax=Flectobacillus major TaxID=103 RepID=UPI0006950489|nr:hypothetical protein [Flectobacillus major]